MKGVRGGHGWTWLWGGAAVAALLAVAVAFSTNGAQEPEPAAGTAEPAATANHGEASPGSHRDADPAEPEPPLQEAAAETEAPPDDPCAEGGEATSAGGQPIPFNARRYMRTLVREARTHFGLTAPVALLAGQIHQESAWRPCVVSHAGAKGLAQFMPATAEWIAEIYPDHLSGAAPFSPGWAIRAMMLYDKYLRKHFTRPLQSGGVAGCDAWAMVLSAYNGGQGWLQRDRKLTRERGDDPDRWWDNVEMHSTRAPGRFEENRSYPRRILHKHQQLYLSQGWQGDVQCL